MGTCGHLSPLVLDQVGVVVTRCGEGTYWGQRGWCPEWGFGYKSSNHNMFTPSEFKRKSGHRTFNLEIVCINK